MAAKVFISCGQRPNERRIAEKIAELLIKYNFIPYLACKVMSLDPITIITKELSSSDYYLFIDFLREVNNQQNDLPISLFTHQELALAHHLGFKNEIIALRQEGIPQKHGFIWYVLSNAETFQNEHDLLNKVEFLIKDKKWNINFSRNLIVKDLLISDPFFYSDHTGEYYQLIGEITVENMRPDVAAVDTVCILDKIINNKGTELVLHDRTYLKWSGQKGYRKTILPKDYGKISIFAIHSQESGLFLNSEQDIVPRKPIIYDDGDYTLFYKIFAENFPLLEFRIQINYRWNAPKGAWQILTSANLFELPH